MSTFTTPIQHSPGGFSYCNFLIWKSIHIKKKKETDLLSIDMIVRIESDETYPKAVLVICLSRLMDIRSTYKNQLYLFLNTSNEQQKTNFLKIYNSIKWNLYRNLTKDVRYTIKQQNGAEQIIKRSEGMERYLFMH